MLPKFLKLVFWSYDFRKIDPQVHKKIIIKQILNYGTKQMTDWMFDHYSVSEIKSALKTVKKNDWDKKSYNFWKIILKK